MDQLPVYFDDPLHTTSLSSYYGNTEFKGLKSWLGLAVGAVASIAVPFLAPAVATAFGGGFFASTIGQSLIGAGIGALGGGAGQAIAGGDILQGALYGGAGGALTGGIGSFFGGTGGTGAGAAAGTGTGAGLTTTGVEAAQLAGTGLAVTPAAATGAAGGISSALTTGVGGKLTDAFLSMAPNAISTAWTSMTAPDQTKYLQQLEKEMQVARGTNIDDFNRRKALYDELFRTAQNIEPEYYGRLAQADVLRATAQQREAILRDDSLKGGASAAQYRQAESRRSGIEGAAQAADAYRSGFGRGLDQRTSTLARAAGVDTRYNNATTTAGLSNLYDLQKRENEETAAGISAALQPFSYAFSNRPPPQNTVA